LHAVFVVTVFMGSAASAQTAQPSKSAEQATRRANPGNLVGHGGPVKAIAGLGSPVLTGSFDYSAIVWDLWTGAPLHRLTDHNGAVNAVAVSPDGRGLTAGDDSIVRLWDLKTGKLLHRFEGHEPGSKIVGLDVSGDGQWAVSAGWDRTARLWNLATLQAGPILRDHRGPVNAAVFADSDDHKTPSPAAKPIVYTASYDGDVRAFGFRDGELLRRTHAAGQSVNVLQRVFVPNGERQDLLLFGTVAGESGILDALSGTIVQRLPNVERPILAADDGVDVIAIGSGDGRIRIFRKRDWSLEHEHRSAFGPVWALRFMVLPTTDPKNINPALYYGGLDDFVTFWPFAPRAAFEPVDGSAYPRRFQQAGKADTTIGRGEIQFARKCSVCHTLTPDGANRAGPTLHQVFGRKIATRPGYAYSPELKTLDITWNAETIAKLFELGPDKFTPGSKMPLQVMSEKSDRDDLIAFLEIATRDAKPADAPVDAVAPTAPQPSPR
jgi:cytochrome c